MVLRVVTGPLLLLWTPLVLLGARVQEMGTTLIIWYKSGESSLDLRAVSIQEGSQNGRQMVWASKQQLPSIYN